MNSNERAYALAALGLVHIQENDTQGRPIKATVPAQDGEFATVRLAREGAGVQVIHCTHQVCGGGVSKPCEAYYNRLVCYHAKSVLVWQAQTKGNSCIFCQSEAEARALVADREGARAACLYIKGGQEQWLAFFPTQTDEEEIRRQQEFAHVTRAIKPVLDALAALKPAPTTTCKKATVKGK